MSCIKIEEEKFWQLAENACKDGATIFAGAGVSSIPPCRLPGFASLTQKIAKVIVRIWHDLGHEGKKIEVTDECLFKFDGIETPLWEISPDTIFYLIPQRMSSVINDWLSNLFKVNCYSPAHSWCIDMINKSSNSTLITPNFDTCFESYVSKIDAEIKVSIGSPSLSALPLIGTRRELIKIHGCATVPSSIQVNIKDEYRTHNYCPLPFAELGLSIVNEISWPSLLKHIIKRPLIFLGYSGNDNFFPYLLSIEEISDATIFWFAHKKSDPRNTARITDLKKSSVKEIYLCHGDLESIPSAKINHLTPGLDEHLDLYDLINQKFDTITAIISLLPALSKIHPQCALYIFKVISSIALNRRRFDDLALLTKITPIINWASGNYIFHNKSKEYEWGIDLLRRTGTINDLAQALAHQALSRIDAGEYNEARKLLTEASSSLYNSLNPDPNLSAEISYSWGEFHYHTGNNKQAIEYYNKTISIAQETGEIHLLGHAYHSKGNVHSMQFEWDQAVENYQKSLKIKEQIADTPGIANSLNGIACAKLSQSVDIDSAIEILKKSLAIKERLNNIMGLCSGYTNIGISLALKGRFDEALEYLNKSIDFKTKANDIPRMPTSLIHTGCVLIILGKISEGRKYIDRALILLMRQPNKQRLLKNVLSIASYFAITSCSKLADVLKDIETQHQQFKGLWNALNTKQFPGITNKNVP